MRVFLCLCTVLAALLIAGCGGDDESTSPTTQAATTADTVAQDTETTETTPETETEQAQAPETETESEPAETTEEPVTPPAGDSGDDSSGGGDAEGAASAAALNFLNGLAKGNGEQACGAMSDQIRAQVEKGLTKSPQFKDKSCSEILTTITSAYPEQVKKQLVDIKVLGVTVKGNTAQVAYRAGTLPKTSVPLVRVNGEWKVGALAAPGTATG